MATERQCRQWECTQSIPCIPSRASLYVQVSAVSSESCWSESNASDIARSARLPKALQKCRALGRAVTRRLFADMYDTKTPACITVYCPRPVIQALAPVDIISPARTDECLFVRCFCQVGYRSCRAIITVILGRLISTLWVC